MQSQSEYRKFFSFFFFSNVKVRKERYATTELQQQQQHIVRPVNERRHNIEGKILTKKRDEIANK